jgi:hypothetical protein
MPAQLSQSLTPTTVGVRSNNTNSGAKAAFALYNVTADGGPGTVAFTGSEVDVSASGLRTASWSNTVPAGFYWAAYNCNQTVAFWGQSLSQFIMSAGKNLSASTYQAASYFTFASTYNNSSWPDLTGQTLTFGDLTGGYAVFGIR